MSTQRSGSNTHTHLSVYLNGETPTNEFWSISCLPTGLWEVSLFKYTPNCSKPNISAPSNLGLYLWVDGTNRTKGDLVGSRPQKSPLPNLDRWSGHPELLFQRKRPINVVAAAGCRWLPEHRRNALVVLGSKINSADLGNHTWS